jgi:hypothetical protein
VLDSYYNFIGAGADIVDYLGMAERVGAIKDIARTLNAAVLLVHHSRKAANAEEGSTAVAAALGSQALAGKVDTIIWLRRREGSWTLAVQSRSRDCPTEGWTLARPQGGRGFVEVTETEARGLDPTEIVARLPEHATPLADVPERERDLIVPFLAEHGHGHDGCLVFPSMRELERALEDSGLAQNGRRTREMLLRDHPQAFIPLTNRRAHMVLMPSGLELLIRPPDGAL